MRRPAGVIVAAIVLGLIALLGIFCAMLGLLFAVFVHNPILNSVFRPIVILSDGLMLCFFLYCAWTVVDLFRLRNWARISAIVIGSLVFIVSVIAGAAMLAARPYAALVPQGPTPVNVSGILVALALFYFFFSLIGVWWIVYFSLSHVRNAFHGARLLVTWPDTLPPGGSPAVPAPPASGSSAWRIVIVAWACLMLLCVLSFPIFFLLRVPLFLGGLIVSGAAANVLLLLFVAAALYIGIGLLRKWKGAWYVALAWQVWTIVNMAAFFFPGTMARFIVYDQQVVTRWLPPGPAPLPPDAFLNGPFLAICFVPGLVLVALFTVALFKRRADYFPA
jgi:hypothetical protein